MARKNRRKYKAKRKTERTLAEKPISGYDFKHHLYYSTSPTPNRDGSETWGKDYVPLRQRRQGGTVS